MKLLFCRACGDIVRLWSENRSCRCGKSRGRYVEDRAVVLLGTEVECLAADTNAVERAVRKVDYSRAPLELNEVSPLEFKMWFAYRGYEHVKREP